MILREYQPSDLKEILELFYHTVHSVNAKDYTPQQLDAWTGGTASFEAWNTSLWSIKHLWLLKAVTLSDSET